MNQIERRPIVLVLDNIRSALNIGAIFRTADAFWIEKIYLCGIAPVPPHVQISKTALGAEKVIPWQKCDSTLDAIELLQKKDYQIIAVEQTSDAVSLEKLSEEQLQYPLALLFGHEVFGVNEEALHKADMKLVIPQYGTKKSLNVATCAGILLWELLKNRC